jgi:hypothetical protein
VSDAETVAGGDHRFLGYKLSRIPGRRAAELVDLLSQEIQLEERREQFKKTLFKEIRQRGY